MNVTSLPEQIDVLSAEKVYVSGVILLTVMLHVPVTKLPSLAVAVMVAEPGATAVTKPASVTVATLVLLELQVTVLSNAVAGVAVAAPSPELVSKQHRE